MRSIKSRTDILSPSQVLLVRNTGFPKGRESYGNGASIIVVEVTLHQGERESRSQGEGRQVSKLERNGGTRMSKAERTLLAMQKLGRKGIPLTSVYRNLYDEELFLGAYNKLC